MFSTDRIGTESAKRGAIRNDKTLTCNLMCSIGDGACDFKVKVNLKTGVATIVHDSEGIFIDEDHGKWDDAEGAGGYVGKNKFKIKVK